MTENAVLAFNALARELVSETKLDPLRAVRVYAILSTTQYEICYELHESDCLGAALVCGSSFVLGELFPAHRAVIQQTHDALVRTGAAGCESCCRTAQGIGQEILHWRAADIALLLLQSVPPPPTDACRWTGTNPLGPHWGCAAPWVIRTPWKFVTVPPPCCGSDTYLQALAEVRFLSDHRTAEQLAIAEKWGAGPGTVTPPGLWNEIAAREIRRRRLSLIDSAQVLYLLNAAMFDAGVVAWAFKYSYWFIRPFQADPLITTPIGRPNFPSYTSGHSTFSAAAATILAQFFPCEEEKFWNLANEAGMSRLFGGIHFSFDNVVGLNAGNKLAKNILHSCGELNQIGEEKWIRET